MLTDMDRESFQRAFAQAMAKFQAPVKDWPDFVRSTYDEQAMVLPPDGPAVRGHEAILAFIEAFPPFFAHQQESLELDGAGDLLYTRDRISVTLAPPGLPPSSYCGKALTIWRRQADGSWKMYREIWNSDSPA